MEDISRNLVCSLIFDKICKCVFVMVGVMCDETENKVCIKVY